VPVLADYEENSSV